MDDLRRELSRLEARVDNARVVDELATVRQEVARERRSSSLQLANVRIATPCKERWADMVGDDRVRVCGGCERPVFNLSEMTREEAEAVLATRGVKPCVRFYRRADGTVMTADCPTGTRRPVPRLAVVAAGTALLGSSLAGAEPAAPVPTDMPAPETAATTDPDATGSGSATPAATPTAVPIEEPLMGEIYIAPSPPRPAVEWSTWARAGIGIAAQAPNVIARSTTPEMPESSSIGEGALGADLSLAAGLHGNLRVGAFTEVRTTSGPVVGGELIVAGLPPRPYGSGGSGSVVLRAGGNGHVITTALGVGYVSSWSRSDDSRLPFIRHASGIRGVFSMNRSLDNPRDWSVTFGIELDPIGALTYVVRAVAH